MAHVELVLRRPHPVQDAGAVELVLGLDEASGDVTFAARFGIGGRIDIAASGVPVVGATVVARFAIGGRIDVSHRRPIYPWVGQTVGAAWESAGQAAHDAGSAWADGDLAGVAHDVPWRDAAPIETRGGDRWHDGDQLGTKGGDRWRDGSQVHAVAGDRWREGRRVDPQRYRLPWRDGTRVGADWRGPWRDGRNARIDAFERWRAARHGHHERLLRWDDGRIPFVPVRVPWRDGALLLTWGSPFPPPADVEPPAPPFVTLQLCRPWRAKAPHAVVLVLGLDPCLGVLPDAPAYILPRRVYMIVHAIAAVRLPDGLPLELFSADISTDDSSFGWTLTASGPPSLLDALAPDDGATPAQMMLTIDGAPFVFAVEGLRRTREFGRSGATITGRSVTALLGAPYMPEAAWLNDAPSTARQIVEKALEFSGIGVDWRVTDWLVPAGAWSVVGTPLAAAQRVAEAAGAVVQSGRIAPSLIVLPRYPALPWQWGDTTPDVQLPLEAITSDGWERIDASAWSGVYVSGQSQGVLALVKRLGTDGALQPTMIVDPLITHDDAARQRGSAVLGGGGPQARVTISLSVHTGDDEPGIIDVGALVQVVEPGDVWRGLVRGVRLRCDSPQVRQTLTIERHLL